MYKHESIVSFSFFLHFYILLNSGIAIFANAQFQDLTLPNTIWSHMVIVTKEVQLHMNYYQPNSL